MNTPANPPLVTLFAGEPMVVALRDGSSVTVTVREMKPSEMGRYLAAVHSLTALVELTTDQAPGWADTVVTADLFRLGEKAKGLNDPFFGQWLAFQAPEMKRLAQTLGGPVSPA